MYSLNRALSRYVYTIILCVQFSLNVFGGLYSVLECCHLKRNCYRPITKYNYNYIANIQFYNNIIIELYVTQLDEFIIPHT